MSNTKPQHATASRLSNQRRLSAKRENRMNTKSRSQNDSVMFHRFQKSLISTAANGARKLRGVRMPKQ